jgi:hypothetical protein
MTSVGRNSLRAQLLEEVIEEMSGLEGEALDEFLYQAGFDKQDLLAEFSGWLRSSGTASGRKRFDTARALLSSPGVRAKVLFLDPSRKQSVFVAVKERMARTGEMTIAARNQRIDSEQDLDSFLDACIELGVINEDGELKG